MDLLFLGSEVRSADATCPTSTKLLRIGEFACDSDDLVLTELRERLHTELRPIVELLDQHPAIRQTVEMAPGAVKGRSQRRFPP